VGLNDDRMSHQSRERRFAIKGACARARGWRQWSTLKIIIRKSRVRLIFSPVALNWRFQEACNHGPFLIAHTACARCTFPPAPDQYTYPSNGRLICPINCKRGDSARIFLDYLRIEWHAPRIYEPILQYISWVCTSFIDTYLVVLILSTYS
jgi:hypothetical protein